MNLRFFYFQMMVYFHYDYFQTYPSKSHGKNCDIEEKLATNTMPEIRKLILTFLDHLL